MTSTLLGISLLEALKKVGLYRTTKAPSLRLTFLFIVYLRVPLFQLHAVPEPSTW